MISPMTPAGTRTRKGVLLYPRASFEVINEFISYDPATGEFRWKKAAAICVKPGEIAGTIDPKGYRRISVKRVVYPAHRIAVLLMTGQWPDGEVDHIDRNPGNNKWENLRQCSARENTRNKSLMSTNTSGVPGVSFDASKDKWIASIGVDRKRYNLGAFVRKADAIKAYMRGSLKYHGKFSPYANTTVAELPAAITECLTTVDLKLVIDEFKRQDADATARLLFPY
jgi:hypothetical protein